MVSSRKAKVAPEPVPVVEEKKSFWSKVSAIEVMVVVLILAILVAIALPVFFNQEKQNSRAALRSDVETTVAAVTAASDAGHLRPGDLSALVVETNPEANKYTVTATATSEDMWVVSGTIDGGTFAVNYSPVAGYSEENTDSPPNPLAFLPMMAVPLMMMGASRSRSRYPSQR